MVTTGTLIGNPIEPIGQRNRAATESGRNRNEAVAGSASEAFARRLHYRYASAELQLAS